MKLLLATDFSDTATRASEIAIALAKRVGDELVLLHVSAPPTHMPQELATDARTFEHALRERARVDLRAAADEARAQGVAVVERLESGEAAEVIAAAARDLGARMIVVGSHGRRALARLVLGSVAQDTLLLADRPILVARRGATAQGFEEWIAGRRHLRVTLGIDRSRGTAAAVSWLRWLRELGPVDVRLVHACDPIGDAYRLGSPPGLPGAGEPEAAIERDLRAFVGDLPGQGAVTFHLATTVGRPGGAVAEDAETSGADLLVLGTNQRARLPRIWLGATAELALRHARMPVVVVPAAQATA
jgi:nucleotide-binding universal stress UspA family protein